MNRHTIVTALTPILMSLALGVAAGCKGPPEAMAVTLEAKQAMVDRIQRLETSLENAHWDLELSSARTAHLLAISTPDTIKPSNDGHRAGYYYRRLRAALPQAMEDAGQAAIARPAPDLSQN